MSQVLEALLDVLMFFYFILGSFSLGYFFLRIGWPKIRTLEKNYKKGWSVIFGAGFFILVAFLAFVLGFFSPFGINYREFLFLLIATSFLFSVAVLSAMRKYFKKSRVSVSVPGTILGAKIAAQKAQAKLERDPSLVIVGAQKEEIEKLKQTLEEKKIQKLDTLVEKKTMQETLQRELGQTEKTEDKTVKGIFAQTEKQKMFEPEISWPAKLADAQKEAQVKSEAEKEQKLKEISKKLEEKQSASKSEPDYESPLQKLLEEKKKKIVMLKEEVEKHG